MSCVMLSSLWVLTCSSLFKSLNEAQTDTYAQQKQQDRKQHGQSRQLIKVQPAVGRISESQHWLSEWPKHFSIPPRSHTSYRKRNSKTIWSGPHTVWIRRQLRSRWAVGAYLLQIWPLLWQNVIVNINLHACALTSACPQGMCGVWRQWFPEANEPLLSKQPPCALRVAEGWQVNGC